MVEELVGSGSNLFIERPRWVGSVGCFNFGFRFRVQLRFRFRVGRVCCVSVVDDLGRVTSSGVCVCSVRFGVSVSAQRVSWVSAGKEGDNLCVRVVVRWWSGVFA